MTPQVKRSIKVDPKVNREILASVETEGVVIIHCTFEPVVATTIRIWYSTYLIDRVSGRKSKLLHAINIPFAQSWRPVTSGTRTKFTLIFSALPKACKVFDLIEMAQSQDSNGFAEFHIERNSSDIYNVEIVDAPF